jgi:hypothetical protein
MAAAAAAPGGELLCAETDGGASGSMKATPIKAKIALRIFMAPLFTDDDCAEPPNSLYTLFHLGALTPKARRPTTASTRVFESGLDERAQTLAARDSIAVGAVRTAHR